MPAPRGKHPPSGGARQVKLWADLLVDLDHGDPSITTSAREMAEDVPSQLRGAVDHELAKRGCPFRIGA